MQITVKLYFEDEVRRVSIGDENGDLTFTHLKSTVDAILPSLHRGNFRLMWKDDDDDLITISSNPEFLEAVSFMTKGGNGAISKFYVKPIPKESKSATTSPFVAGMDAASVPSPVPSATIPVVHEGVQCDECGAKPIVGVRYKCTGRFNYDLCASCEAKDTQPYPMMKIEDPSSAPTTWQTLAHHYLPGFGGRGGWGRGGWGRGAGGHHGGLHGGRGWGGVGRNPFGAPRCPSSQNDDPFRRASMTHTPPSDPSDPFRAWRASRASRENGPVVVTAAPATPDTTERAVHTGVSCKECGILPIVGPRFKCAVRENHDLCGACESRSAPSPDASSPQYPMLKIDRPEDAPGTFIYMFNKRAVIGGCPTGYRRRNLEATGNTAGAVVHRHVGCNQCGTCPIVGARFKCAVRDDFDLCQSCEAAHPQPYPMVKIYHPQHRPSAIVYTAVQAPVVGTAASSRVSAAPAPAGAVPVAQVQSQVHTGVQCDQCNVLPIVGTRYKCTGRSDYDLCATCEAALPNQPYPMLKVTDPQQAPAQFVYEVRHAKPAPTLVPLRNPTQQQVHFGVRCDECGQNPIQGPRFKCAIRNDFDLCASCESARPQPYPVVKLYDPAHHPSKLIYVLPAAPTAVPAPSPSVVAGAATIAQAPVSAAAAAPSPATPARAPVPSVAHVPTVAPAVAALPKPSLRFVRDRTLPDGTSVQAGQEGLVKIWDVRNDGQHPWPVGSQLTFAGGDVLHGPSAALTVGGTVPPLRAGEEGQLSVQLCVPRQAGRYVGYYRMQTPEGQNFGQRLWADIVVVPQVSADGVAALSAEETAAQEEADRLLAEELNALILETEVDAFLTSHHEGTESAAAAPVEVAAASEADSATVTDSVSSDVGTDVSALKQLSQKECEWDMVGRCVTLMGGVLEEVPEEESDGESEYTTGVHQPLALNSSQQGGLVPDNMVASYDHICGDVDFDETDADSATAAASASASASVSISALPNDADEDAAILDLCLQMNMSNSASATESKEQELEHELEAQQDGDHIHMASASMQRQPSAASPVIRRLEPAAAPVPVLPVPQEESEADVNAREWQKELQMLGEMGFCDTAAIIPLLQRHLHTPLSLQGADAAVNTPGLHAVLTDLLSSA